MGQADESGYHPIETVMQTVGLYDTIVVEPDDITTVTYDPPYAGPGDTVRTALSLAEECFEVPPMRVRVEKAIPTRSGLGGGSSDAAGALRILGLLAGDRLGPVERLEIAARIGMDVPFFLYGGRAHCHGYGQRVEPEGDGEKTVYVLAKPSVGVASGAAYAQLDESSLRLRGAPSDLRSMSNEFVNVAPAESRELIQALLEAGASQASLTGSGSACFGTFDDERAANRAAEALSPLGRTWVVPSIGAQESLWTSFS
ncbi:MAG: hypothetical protein IT207_09415 [Fimbriimonadaceae bacterium]|nr:hypothetical protein [Fimbriimonadaceae bacterium]